MYRMNVQIVSVTLALSAALAAGGALADERDGSLESARRAMELGQAAFAKADYAAAGAHFLDAYAASPFPAFLYNAGLAAEKGGDDAKAVEMFERYLEEEPGAADAAEIEAKIRTLRPQPATHVAVTEVETAAAVAPEAPPPAPADVEMKSLVSVRVNPASARIRIVDAQGREVAAFTGRTAKTVVRGEYRIEASHPDYKTVTTDLAVVPGQVYVVVVEMSQGAFLGYLGISTDPPGAEVFVDAEKGAVGTTPWSNVLPPGEHEIRVEKPGFTPVSRRVTVSLGSELSVEIPLERLPFGMLLVKANVPGARVFLDGKPLGAAPLEERASPGRHALRVEADGMKDYAVDVDIEPGKTTKALVRLNRTPSRTSGWVSGGVAVALFAAGGVFGGVALHLDNELEADKKAGRLADDDPRIVHGFLWALGADVSFGLGLVVSGMCAYYFLRDPLPPSEGKLAAPVDMESNPEEATEGEPERAETPPAPSARVARGPRFAVAPLVTKDAVGFGFAASF